MEWLQKKQILQMRLSQVSIHCFYLSLVTSWFPQTRNPSTNAGALSLTRNVVGIQVGALHWFPSFLLYASHVVVPLPAGSLV